MIKRTMALGAAMLTGQAMAQAGAPVRVTLAVPVARDGALRALATSWTCTGTACTGPEINTRLGDARACREIAKVAGAVTAFATARGELGADDLTRCNKSAKKAS